MYKKPIQEIKNEGYRISQREGTRAITYRKACIGLEEKTSGEPDLQITYGYPLGHIQIVSMGT